MTNQIILILANTNNDQPLPFPEDQPWIATRERDKKIERERQENTSYLRRRHRRTDDEPDDETTNLFQSGLSLDRETSETMIRGSTNER
jgi:hypothetical protein